MCAWSRKIKNCLRIHPCTYLWSQRIKKSAKQIPTDATYQVD